MKYRHSFNINLKNKVLVLNYIPNSIPGNKESCSILLTAHRIKNLHQDFDRRSKQRGKIVVFRETVDTSNPVPTHIIVEGAPSWREKRKARADRAENNWISGGGWGRNNRGKKRNLDVKGRLKQRATNWTKPRDTNATKDELKRG